MPTVYIGMTADILHHGHINVVNHARKYGDVLVGLLTDAAIADHKRLPYLTWNHRKQVVENIKGVIKVVPQSEWDYVPNIRRYRPDFMVHGTDWLDGPLAPFRERALAALAEYGGQLIEVPYTKGVSGDDLARHMRAVGTTPELRLGTLKRLLAARPLCRFIQAHSPLSALIAEHARIQLNDKVRQFDGFWSSSLADSAARGKPDIEALEISARLANIDEIFDVTTKPLIMDADTGGKAEHFELKVRSMERLGVSAAVIEDKSGLKRNSLFGNDVVQEQEAVESFCAKIRLGRAARVGHEFMIIARIESLILERGMDDALERAHAYVAAGADGIMIHSRSRSPGEVFEFAKLFKRDKPTIPLVSVPTSYNIVTEQELAENGFNIVIYANQMIRAAYPAMQRVAYQILQSERSAEVEDDLMAIKEIIELIPVGNLDRS